MNRPLRIFFGRFDNAGVHYATLAGDQVFPDFLLGTYEAGDPTLRLHSRYPTGALGDIDEYDEYLDLKYSGLGMETADTVGRYKNIAGVESQIYWSDDALAFDPTNILSIQTHGIEFGYPTQRLSLPYPKPSPAPEPPSLVIRNNVLHEDAVGFFKFWVELENAAATHKSSPSQGVVVGYDVAGVNCDVTIYHEGDLTNTFNLYRAEVFFDEFRQEWILKSLPKLLDNYDAATLTATPHTFTADLCDTVAEPYAAPAVIMEQVAQNDARARVKFDFLTRRRLIAGVPSQRWLVLNVDTHHYYKGIIGALSDVFLAGWGFQDAKNVQLSLLISEEGMFLDDALTSPNDADYFKAFTRTIV